jgi:hypothetical protein
LGMKVFNPAGWPWPTRVAAGATGPPIPLRASPARTHVTTDVTRDEREATTCDMTLDAPCATVACIALTLCVWPRARSRRRRRVHSTTPT